MDQSIAIQKTQDKILEQVITKGDLADLSPADRIRQEKIRRRFEKRIVFASSGCWEWTGALTSAGYGLMQTGERTPAGNYKPTYTHRLAYELYVGPIPKGLSIDHLCRNPRCANPSHLEAVPIGVNVLRGTGMSAMHAKAIHCKRGHLKTPANMYIRPDGYRECRLCMRRRNKERTSKRRQANESHS